MVVILPADHYVSDDARCMAHVASGFAAVDRYPDLVILLGIEPDTAETEYGWIEPGDGLPGSDLRCVRHFWEKPAPTMARRLLADGCLWNSFVMVAPVAASLGLIGRTLPALDAAVRPIRAAVGTAAEADAAREVYARLSPLDCSTFPSKCWLGTPAISPCSRSPASTRPTWDSRAECWPRRERSGSSPTWAGGLEAESA